MVGDRAELQVIKAIFPELFREVRIAKPLDTAVVFTGAQHWAESEVVAAACAYARHLRIIVTNGDEERLL